MKGDAEQLVRGPVDDVVVIVPNVNPVEVVLTVSVVVFNTREVIGELSLELDFPKGIADPTGCKGVLKVVILLVIELVFKTSGFVLDKSNLNPPTFAEFVGDGTFVESDFEIAILVDGAEFIDPPNVN